MVLTVVLSDPAVGFCSQQDASLELYNNKFIYIIGMLSWMVCLLLCLRQADDYDVIREGALV